MNWRLRTTPSDSFLFVHQDSLEYFGERRTDKSRSSKFQGVETPSQVRRSHSGAILTKNLGREKKKDILPFCRLHSKPVCVDLTSAFFVVLQKQICGRQEWPHMRCFQTLPAVFTQYTCIPVPLHIFSYFDNEKRFVENHKILLLYCLLS